MKKKKWEKYFHFWNIWQNDLIILQIWLQEEDFILSIWEIPLQGKLLYSLVKFMKKKMGKIFLLLYFWNIW